MRYCPSPPDVADNGWSDTTTTAKKLGVERTTFWRMVKAGRIKRRMCAIDNKYRYQGKDIRKLWYSFL